MEGIDAVEGVALATRKVGAKDRWLPVSRLCSIVSRFLLIPIISRIRLSKSQITMRQRLYSTNETDVQVNVLAIQDSRFLEYTGLVEPKRRRKNETSFINEYLIKIYKRPETLRIFFEQANVNSYNLYK